MNTLLLRTASALVLVAAATAANAQTQAAAQPAAQTVAQRDEAQATAPQDLEAVEVTGSRIARAGFQAPTPVTVASTEQLTAATPTTIGDALRQLPSLNSSVGPRGAQTSGGQGGAFLNLRNLGAIRTLTLFDGRRFVSQGGSGLVDTNLFPQALVSRVEVVTGGASAAYGSDAVSGVVNFILDRKYQGFKGEAQLGVSDRQDGEEQRYSLAYGTPLFEGRGHFIGSLEYFKANEIPERLSREVAQRSCQIITLPAGSATARDYACNVRVSNANFNGLVTGPTALRGITFDDAGNPVPFNYGTLVTGSTMVGGDGVIPQFAPLSAGIDKRVGFGRASYDITEDMTAFVELLYAQNRIGYQVGSFSNMLGNTALRIQRDNAFLPASLRNAMIANNVQSITVGKYLAELPKSQVMTMDHTRRFAGGVDGVAAGWDYSAYVELAENRRKLQIGNDLILPNYVRATDAVIDPATGRIVCRTNEGATPGCIPVNPFGRPQLTEDQQRYIAGTNYNLTRSHEYVAAFEVSNEIFELPAGPVSFAAGAEHRVVGFDQIVDEGSVAPNFVTNGQGVYRVGNARPQDGEYKVTEGFAETIVPLVRDAAWAKELELNAAARLTHYSTSGSVTTWKVGVSYEPVDGLRFRGTRSRDIRAPTLNELFQAGVTNFIPSVFDRVRGVQVTNARSITFGNIDLKPEIANTLTMGVVYSPSFVSGFDLSLDYYKIKIDDAITTPNNNFVIDECARGVQELCDRLIRDAAGNLLTVELVPLNLQTFETEGFDIEASYRVSLDDVLPAIGGELSLRAIANRTTSYIVQLQGATAQDQVGESGTAPKWRAVVQANYERGPLGVFVQARYTGSGVFDKFTAPSDLRQLKIGDETIWNTRLSYRFEAAGGDWTAYFNVQNIFDNLPPDLVPTAGQYDPIGRYFRAGVKFNF
jgi:outer membrane receptor protein involved in Fe transport